MKILPCLVIKQKNISKKLAKKQEVINAYAIIDKALPQNMKEQIAPLADLLGRFGRKKLFRFNLKQADGLYGNHIDLAISKIRYKNVNLGFITLLPEDVLLERKLINSQDDMRKIANKIKNYLKNLDNK